LHRSVTQSSKQKLSGEAPEDGKEIRRRWRARAHRRRRIWPRIPADMRNSGDGLCRFGEELAREKKGGRGRSLRGLYRGRCRGEGVRAWAHGRDR
jgi:hypothetical protein